MAVANLTGSLKDAARQRFILDLETSDCPPDQANTEGPLRAVLEHAQSFPSFHAIFQRGPCS